MKPTCSTCRYFDVTQYSVNISAAGEIGGQCRIRSVAGAFPIRSNNDWCGEYQPEGIAVQPGEDVFGGGNIVQTGKNTISSPFVFKHGVSDIPMTTGTWAVQLISFNDWRIGSPSLGNLLFIRHDGDGTRLDWEQLFNRHGDAAFTKAVEFAKEHGATKIFFNEMLTYFEKVKP